jgi:uncharacterized membrane-anchored protein
MTEGNGVSAHRSHARTATMQTASKQIAAWLGHWRYALLAVVALGQAAVLVYMVADREALLANGRAIDLKVVPLDPRDLFRGDYVTLSYDISRIPRSMIAGELHRGDKLFVRLAHDVEGWKPVTAARTRQQAGSAGAGEIVLAGRVRFAPRVFTTSADQSISVNYGIEKFFVPEGVGREIEKEVRAKDVTAHVAVGTDGIAALKGLTVSGVRYDLPPLF